MPAVEEQKDVVQDEADSFTENFVVEMQKIESLPEPPLYHGRPGVHATPPEKRSPYWQPVDDQS
jgi:hypothetical protein